MRAFRGNSPVNNAAGYIAKACGRSPETKLTIQFVSMVREAQANGLVRPDVVWWHTPNEGKLRTPAEGALRAAMGVLSGAPDFVFVRGDRVALIELKSDSGSLSTNQRAIRDRMAAAGGKLHVCRTVDQCFVVLESAGMLREGFSWMR